ncbi:MAG: DUF134 domain-containing protein [Desulfovibrio sp.]|nr:DUF134 domain-containing protein [Desulfovibrio sp.]
MVRPRRCCHISQRPNATYFKPCGVPLRLLEEISLSVEGVEALRLSDLEGLNTSEASAKVHVSRFTYARILSKARKAVAEAVVTGKCLRIEGGTYSFVETAVTAYCGCERRSDMTLIAISSEGPSLNDAVDPRYGRAGGFIIAACPADGSEMQVSYLDNGDAQLLPQGAGIATTEHLVRAGVNVVISGYVGPKAFEALQAAGIAVIQNMDGISVGEALHRYREGQCQEACAPNHDAGVQG